MTRDEYLTQLYAQRGRSLRWLRSEGVPTADAEIIVDRGIENGLAQFDKGKVYKSLSILSRGYLKDFRESRMGKVVPTGDLERLENSLEQKKRGRVAPAPSAE